MGTGTGRMLARGALVQREALNNGQHVRMEGGGGEGLVIRAGAELHLHQEPLRALHRHPAPPPPPGHRPWHSCSTSCCSTRHVGSRHFGGRR